MSADLKVVISSAADIPVVTLTGRPDLRDTPMIMTVLDQQLRSHAYSTVICDLSRMTPPKIEALLTVFPAALRRAGGWPCHSLRLAAPSTELAQALARIRMHRYLPVHPTLTEAVSRARRDAALAHRTIRLAPDPSSPRAARALVNDIQDQLPTALRDDAELVVSELTANAARHVEAPFELAVAVAPDQVLIAVTDPSRTEPILRPARNTAVNGRGLQLVASLSRTWGVQLVHQGGKVVWAELDTQPSRPTALGA